MALRAESSNSSSLTLSTTAMSHLVGLPVYWHEANSTPTMDWDKWLDLFQVAVMAKFSISITELTRDADQQNPRARALLGDMDEDPANKKVVSVLYLSLGEAARKLFKDKYPHTTLWNLKVRELIQPDKRKPNPRPAQFFFRECSNPARRSTILAHAKWASSPL